MGHQELSRLRRQAWTETGPREKPWVRRRARKDQKEGERSSHYPADTAGSLSAMGGAGPNCQTGTSLNSACCSLGLVTATCSTTGALHPEWSWAGFSDLGQIVGSSAKGSLMPKLVSAFPELPWQILSSSSLNALLFSKVMPAPQLASEPCVQS